MTALHTLGPRAVLALALLLLPSAALADVIHLESGGKYKGTITSESSRSVTIETNVGKLRVPRDEISRIVREEDLGAAFKARLKTVKGSKSASRWVELGNWAKDKELDRKAKKCFAKAIECDPDCEPARLALGHEQHEGQWYTRDDYRRDVLGLVEHEGKWVTPEAKTNLEAGLVERDGRWVLPEEEKPAAKPRAKKSTSVPASARKKRASKGVVKKERGRRGKGAKFKAMSFNVRYDFGSDDNHRWHKRLGGVVEVIRQASVVAIQEDKAHQVDDLRKELPDYEIVGGGRNATGSGERCSILVRKKEGKIREWGEFWLSDTPDVKGSNTWRDRYPRKVTWALIELRGARSPLLVLNTHLPEKDSGRDPENRVKGMQVMNQWLRNKLSAKERKKVAILIAGDYNSTPQDEPRKMLVGSGETATGLRDSYGEAPHGSIVGTYNGFKGLQGRQRIDWLLVGGPIRVRLYSVFAEKVDGRWPSDHYPVTADLELR